MKEVISFLSDQKYSSDRHSRRFRSLLAHEDENKIYYTISTIIAKK